MEFDMNGLATRQLRDRDAGRPGTLFAEQITLSEKQAYAIASEVSRLREARGDSVVGYKVGCTSAGIQQQLGIDHPVFGHLFESECWPSGVTLPPEQFPGLAIEGELAVRLASNVSAAGISGAKLCDVIESVFPVIELHHFIFRGNPPSAQELIANNAIHAGFVHATNPSTTLDFEPATLQIEIDGVLVATVSGTELASTVVDSLDWLASELQQLGHDLEAGQTILCGSIADLIPLPKGGQVVVTTDRWGSVQCTIAADTHC